MASCCKLVPQSEISVLKDALSTQQKLLQKLYSELEAEREASATAASEALSVILRLQGEKAAVKMEAEQYKRLAEERMCHAEESFALIEDMITEKEMEVAELDYQVQTYRYQLMSMGFDVPDGDDINIPETSLHHFKCKKAMLESSTSIGTDSISKSEEQMGQEKNEFASESERKADVSTDEGISSYAEQIKELEIRVKDIGGVNTTGIMSESHSPSLSSPPSAANLCSLSNSDNSQTETRLPSQLSISSSFDPNELDTVNENDQIKHPENSPKNSEGALSPHPPKVHDVFEVPQADRESTPYESSNKDRQKAAIDILGSQAHAHLEAVRLIPKDEPDWLKKLLQSTDHDKNLCKPSDIAAIDRAIVQPSTSVAVSFVQPTTNVDVSESNLNRLNMSPEISEVDQRPAESPDREEELKLLKEIREKLNLLQAEILFKKMKKSCAKEEPSLHPLAEVMLSFWL